MSVRIPIETNFEGNGAPEKIEKLAEALRDVGEIMKDVSKELGGLEKDAKDGAKGVDTLNKKTKKTSKSMKGLGGASSLASKGIKGIGTAMKAAGIGLVVSAIAGLMAVFSKNQKVVDFMSTAMNTLQLGFNAVTGAISSAYEKVTEATGGFDALKKVVGGLITIALTPLKANFYALKAAAQGLKLAYEKMFGSDEGVKQAQAALQETKKDMIELAKETIQAGKDVVTNIVEAAGEVGTMVSTTVGELSKIEPKKIVEAASAMTQLGNSALIAAAKQAGLVEQYNILAEQQRQLRDDTSKSIEDRIKANDKLKETLEKQSEAMLKQADIQIAAASAEAEANNSIENRVKLQEALNNKKAIEAQIEGFNSEQKTNAVALSKELIALDLGRTEAAALLGIERKRFNAEMIQDDLTRIAALRAILEEERIIEEERLTMKRDSYAKGTQEFQDAQDELNAYKESNRQENLSLDQQEIDATRVAEETKVKLKQEALNTANQMIGLVKNVFGKNKKLQAAALIGESAVGIAQMIIKNNAANVAALATPQAVATSGAAAAPVIAMNNIQTGIGVASTIAATAKGLKALKAGGAAPSAAGAKAGGRVAAPTFNTVGQGPASNNTVAQGTQAQIDNQNNNPTRAYVVSTDVSDQQALDREIEGQSSL